MADVQLRVLASSLCPDAAPPPMATMATALQRPAAEAEAVRVTPLDGERTRRLAELTSRLYQSGLVRLRVEGPGSDGARKGCALPTPFVPWADKVRAFEVQGNDVWLVAPPKCGSTLMQELVWLLLNDLDFDATKHTPLLQRFPLLEFSLLLNGAEAEEAAEAEVSPADSLARAEQLGQSTGAPRCLKSHLPRALLPTQLWTRAPKIIYVAREAKDAAVAYFHHDRLVNGYSGDQEFHMECFMDDTLLYTPFWEHVLELWEMRKQPNIFFITFEDMKKDLNGVIRRLAEFLDRDVSDAQVARLVEEFDDRGVVGEGKRVMAPATAARFDSWSRERLAGSDFPWIP